MVNIDTVYNKYIVSAYGYELEDNNLINQIKACIKYLDDNCYSEREILNYMLKHSFKITNDLWNNKLTKPNEFYYHSHLRITNESIIWSPETGQAPAKFFLEMKSNFDMNKLMDYYYSKLTIPVELRNKSRDKGAFEYLLKQYKFEKYTSLDFVLSLIDIASQSESKSVHSPLDLDGYVVETYERLNTVVNNAKVKTITWREDLCIAI